MLAFHHCDKIPKKVGLKEEIFNLAHSVGGFSPRSAVGLKPGWNTMSQRLGDRKPFPPGKPGRRGRRTEDQARNKIFLSKACLSLVTHFL